jgi:hypothetical protein
MQLHSDISSMFEQTQSLIDKELPDQSKNLSDNVINLQKVAHYCEDIYVNSKEPDKQHLLNETKSYTTQALASVAYQIHVLANSFLGLLDNQSHILNDMATSMAHLSHEVNIHKEKVARREIGVLTANKCVVRTSKIKLPEADEKPVKYIRKPIDYSLLDDIGHGVKLTRQSANLDPLSKIGVARQNSYSSTHSSSGISGSVVSSSATAATPAGGSGKGEAAPTPPLSLKASAMMSAGNGLSTVRSTGSTASSYYRTPVIPPSVPSEYLSRQELGIYSSKKELNQSASSGVGDTISGAYGGPPPLGYRRPSQNSNNNMNMSGTTLNPPVGGSSSSEYSGADTLDKRIANSYLHQYSYTGLSGMGMGMGMGGGVGLPHAFALGNSGIVGSNNGAAIGLNTSQANTSVGYASGKEIGLIRTNLNNIDYATNGTMYRRPQLHNSSIYERSMQQAAAAAEQARSSSSSSSVVQQQSIGVYSRSDSQRGAQAQSGTANLSMNSSNNSATLGQQQHLMNSSNPNNSMASNNGCGAASQPPAPPQPPPPPMHGLPLPPPPPLLFAAVGSNRLETNLLGNNLDNIEHDELDVVDYMDRAPMDNNDDDDIIPNWVPIDRCIEKVITTYDYQGTREDELSFKDNQYIYVIKKNDDHWYEGIMMNEEGKIITGLYPYNYARCVRKYIPDDPRITEC